MTTEIRIPALGENIESAEVLAVLVRAGEWVEKDQPIIELETDKATAEVPAESSGVVLEVLLKAGQTVQVGDAILRIESTAEKPSAGPAGLGAAASTSTFAVSTPTAAAPAPESTPASTPAPADAAARPLRLVDEPAAVPDEPGMPPEVGEPAPAAPSVRRLARELGIDINRVPGQGPQGRVSEEDVKTFARRLLAGGGARPAPLSVVETAGTPELPDFSPWGDVEREPASRIRRVTAEAMSLSWSVIPHVTQFDRADVTELEAWRKRTASRVEGAGGKLTLTAIAVKVLASALKVHPKFNASYDARTEEIVYKKYVNVGVAVDTDHGLLVPVIHGADARNIMSIAAELGDLAERARSRKIQAEELQGANINLSNLGGLGTTYFSPLVAWPHLAVLGLGRATVEAVHRDGAFQPRLILPLSVSYDHRVIDGADAARFLRWMAEAFEEPVLLALEG